MSPEESSSPRPEAADEPGPATPAPGPEGPTETPGATPDAANAEEVAPATSRKRGKGKWIALGGVGALVVALVVLVAYLLVPPARADFSDPVDAETRSTNAALFATLVAAGIEDPFVDANAARVYVAYSLPNASLPQAETYQRFVVGAAADASPGSTQVRVFQYFDDVPHQLWVVEMAEFLAYVRGDLTAEQLEAAITKIGF